MKKCIKNFQIDSINFMRLFSFTIILTFIAPVFAHAQAGKVNFSGTWTLNADKSNLGDTGGRRFGGGDFIATQEANLLAVERTRTNRDGESVTTTNKYTLDGKESVNTTGRGESKSTAKWSADGKTLTIVTVSSFNGNERTSTEVWALTDSKTISITSTRQNRDGEEVKTTRVYDKK
ncbi:MAG: hypothetical protein HQ541_04300 [Mariniphaga sp.]|nr:hypothetical protein [Mariniphaga sp.]